MNTARTRSEIPAAAAVVLHVGRQFRARENAVAEAALVRHDGVLWLQANPVAQTATVRYDPSLTSVAELLWVAERAGFECAGCNVPGCLCDPLHKPGRPERAHDAAAVARAREPGGQGEGGHRGHSMDQMARQMRNRFVLALVFTLAILAWVRGRLSRLLTGRFRPPRCPVQGLTVARARPLVPIRTHRPKREIHAGSAHRVAAATRRPPGAAATLASAGDAAFR